MRTQRIRLQFALRSLFIVTALCAVAMSWRTCVRRAVDRQVEVVEQLQEAGYLIFFEPSPPGIVRSFVGGAYGTRFTGVQAHGASDPSIASLLHNLLDLRDVDLYGMAVRDDNFAQLATLPNLEYLSFDCANLTQRGIKHFACMTKLKVLRLESIIDESDVSAGACFRQIGMLPSLKSLKLSGIAYSDDDLRFLRSSRIERLWFDDYFTTGISDDGLKHLTDIESLRFLRFGLRYDSTGEPLKDMQSLESLLWPWGRKIGIFRATERGTPYCRI